MGPGTIGPMSQPAPPPPRTARGEATRRSILDTARDLFAQNGFHRTTVPAIVAGAGIGHGTFYEYFRNRREVLLELVNEAQATAILSAGPAPPSLGERIRRDVEMFLAGYVANLELSKIWVEASAFDPKVAEIRGRMRAPLVSRIRRGIEAAGAQGIDPEMAAVALAAMTEQFAYVWFVEGVGPGHEDHDVRQAALTLSALWSRAIGVHIPSTDGNGRG